MNRTAFSIALPPLGDWKDATDVEAYACACLQAAKLDDWKFQWDRAARRLGCCKPAARSISLSIHFVNAFLGKDRELIRKTILHELAHALAWANDRAAGHGGSWKYFCSALGIPGEKARCRCDDFAPPSVSGKPNRYALCHKETGEIFHLYKRKPRLTNRRLATAYIPGRKDSTLGKLRIIPLQSDPS